jgi:hypothetical protein
MPEATAKSELRQFGYSAIALAVVIAIAVGFAIPDLSRFAQWGDGDAWLRDGVLSEPAWHALKSAFCITTDGQFIPTALLSFLFDRMLFGTTAFFYHLHSLFGHITGSIVLMAFYRVLGMKLRWSFAMAALWALLPPQLANAFGIATRITVARNLFSFLALLIFAYAFHKPQRWRWALACGAAGLIAAGASVQCLLLPILMFIAAFYQSNGTLKARFEQVLRQGAPALFLVVLAQLAIQYVTTLHAPAGLSCSLFHSFICGFLGIVLTRMTAHKTL